MTDITRASVSYETNSAMRALQLGDGLIAGENLTKSDACFIHSDGKVYQSDAADHIDSLDITVTIGEDEDTISFDVAKFDGFATEDFAAGDAVELLGAGAIWKYASGLTPGAFYWVSGTQGSLSDARVAANDSAVAKAIDAYNIRILR